jgi:hypothetical protein
VERLLRIKQPATVMFLDANTPPKLNPTQLLLSPPLLDLLASALPHVTDRVTPSSQIRSVHRFRLGGGVTGSERRTMMVAERRVVWWRTTTGYVEVRVYGLSLGRR